MFTAGAPVSPYAGTLFTTRSSPFVDKGPVYSGTSLTAAKTKLAPPLYSGTSLTAANTPLVDKGPVYSGISALRASTASPFSFTGVLVASGPL